jgi:HAD superfamily hydrolase (TIGR01484 family)
MRKDLGSKKLIVFDLDGTLAESKSKMDSQMNALIAELLLDRKVAVIGGGKYDLFKSQFVRELNVPKELLKNLFLFPTTATSFYRYDGGWKNMYSLHLTKKERADIKKAFKDAFEEVGYIHPKKTYGKVIEDRGTQVTFSALGQEVVAMLGKKGLALKDKWKEENTPLKLKLAKVLQRRLPKLEVRAAGHTSIDVTRKGIDKAYGIEQIEKNLHIPKKQMLFIGDAIFPGGNDYAVKRTGVKCIPVKGPEDTKQIIREILAS